MRLSACCKQNNFLAAKDFDGVKKLIEIAKKARFSYDSEKNVRIGSKRFFPAELHFYWLSRKISEETQDFLCFEFIDLSLDKKFKALQKKEHSLRQTQSELIRTTNINSLTDLASGIAHEVKNPLAIIDGCLEIMKSRLDSEDKDREFTLKMAQKISDASQRINTLVSGLQGFTEKRANNSTQNSNVCELVQNILDLYSEKCRARDIEVIFEKEYLEDIELLCFPDEISQACLHIVKNSYDALENIEGGFIRVEISDLQTTVEIKFSNNGPKIPDYLKDRILEPFFTTKEIGASSGLGLSIVQGAMTSHGGRLCIEEENSITSFSLVIPKTASKLEKSSKAS